MSTVKNYLAIYWQLVKAGVAAQVQYRVAFFTRIIGLLFSYVTTAMLMWFLLNNFDSLGGWDLYELLFLYGLAIFSWGFCILFFFHFRTLDSYIVNGTFDRFLVRPINPFFHFMTMKFDTAAIGQFLFGLIIFLKVSDNLAIQWDISNSLFLIGAIIGGALIQGGVLVLISAMAFWTTKSEQFYWVIMYPSRNLINYPLMIYPKIIQYFFAFVIPFGFINYFPTAILLNKETDLFPTWLGYTTPLVGFIFFYISYKVWMYGLKHYKSTGS